MRRTPESPVMLDDITQLVVMGDSLVADVAGTSDRTRDVMTRFAQMIKAKEYNYAMGGAVLPWHMDVPNSEFGIYPQVLQNHKRPIRPASVIATVDPAVGATSLTLGHSGGSATGLTQKPFKKDTLLHVGTGDAGSSGGEIVVCNTDQTVATINIKAPENWEQQGASGGFVRDHAIGDPVYEVPAHYGAGNTIYFLTCSHNHLARHGLGSASENWFKNALRTVLARLRCAEVYEPDHRGALKFTGTWGAIVSSPSSSSGYGTGGAGVGAGAIAPGAVSAAVEFHLPDNFAGGTALMSFLMTNAAGAGVFSFTVDGVAAGTFTPPVSPTIPRAKNTVWCKRFTGLTPGRHKIVATMTTYEAGHYFDFAGIEAPEAPIIVLFQPHRLYHYSLFTSGWYYGSILSTLAAAATANDASISVAQTWQAGARQIAATAGQTNAQGPKVGEKITLSPGLAAEETKTVAAVTGTGPFTVTFSDGNLANSHLNGARVEMGAKDSDLPTVRSWINSVADEFDGNVVRFDPEPFIAKQRRFFSPIDLVHWNDEGHAVVAQAIYDQLVEERRISTKLVARLSRPVGVPAAQIDFLNTAVAVAMTNQPAALSEFHLGAPGNFRRPGDLSRYESARMIAIQTALGAANAKLRVQFSLDGGTTWFYLFRKLAATTAPHTDYTEPALNTDLSIEIPLGTALPAGNLKVSPWGIIYPDALTDVILRLVGIGGDAVLDPAFWFLGLELR